MIILIIYDYIHTYRYKYFSEIQRYIQTKIKRILLYIYIFITHTYMQTEELLQCI